MTGNEIAELASSYLGGEPIDTALLLINDCLLDIGEDAGVNDKQSFSASADTWYDLPSDALAIRRVVNSHGTIIFDYDILDNQIKFTYTETFTVHYTKMPTPILSLNDTVVIHPLYKHAIALYVASLFLDEKEDGDQVKSQELWIKYQESKRKAKKGSTVSRKGRRVRTVGW